MIKVRSTGLFLAAAALVLAVSCGEDPKKDEKPEPMTANDPHSFAKPEESVVRHLSWDATVDMGNERINAAATLLLENGPDAKALILDSHGLEIEKVTLEDGSEARWSLGEAKPFMGQPLSIEITPEVKQVTVHYHTTQGAEALQWLAPEQTADGSDPFLFTQSQAILARTWVPIQDSPGIRFTYDAKVKVPEGLMALMSAENPTELAPDGIYTFKMDQPVPAYLLALSVGNVEFRDLGPRSGVYAEPSLADAAANEFAELEQMIAAAEALYGPYAWERYDLIVLPPSFPFGGMENPRLTFATPTIIAGDRSLTSLVAHELAHSWSGNLVTNANWDDFWLNEGFTVYFEMRIMESLYGRSYSEMLASLAADDLNEEVKEFIANGQADDTKLKLMLTGRSPEDGMTAIPYDKGYLFLRSLEELVGREQFDAFLKEYFQSHAFETMTTEEFIEYMKVNLLVKNGIEPKPEIWEPWIYGTGLPENRPQPSSDRFAQVEAAAASFLSGTTPAELKTSEYSSHEWLHFVRQMPADLSNEQMATLDEAFGFTRTGNSEVLFAWLKLSIQTDYAPGMERLKVFIGRVGRKKFTYPLYESLYKKSEEGKKLAKEYFSDFKNNYHPVTKNSVAELLRD